MTRAYAPDGDMDAELSAFFHEHMEDGSMVEWLRWLGASKLGRPVYEKFGFREDNSWLVMHNGD